MYVNLAREIDTLLAGLHEVYVYTYTSSVVSFEHNTTGLPEDVAYATIERLGVASYRVQYTGCGIHYFDNMNDAITYLAECVGDHNNNEREV